MLIHQRVESFRAATPEAIAVELGQRSLSFRELDERANKLAHYLRSKGAGPESIVGVAMGRSLDLVVTLLGVLKSGAAYLPLDPNYPPARNDFMLRDSAAKIVVTDQSEIAAPEGVERLVWSEMRKELASLPDAAPESGALPENIAYVIYTSGSTGTPKGVAVEHAQVGRLFEQCQPWFEFAPSDRWSFFHSFAFDFSVWEVWGALCTGGTVVVVPDTVRRSPDDFWQLLRESKVTILNQIPSAFRALSEAALAKESDGGDLRFVIFGGEALELSSLKPWFDKFKDGPQLINMYGITETTVHVTFRRIVASDCDEVSGSPIGEPIPDLSLHLLNESLESSESEAEIFVGGKGLARGYLGRPSLTAERFVPDPFSAEPGARMYRSGDLGRRYDDGSFEHCGRNDSQVKIRGFRIETGEISASLEQHPQVKRAFVIAMRKDKDDERLVGYVAPKAAADLPLREHVAASLPDYMVPATIVGIDEFPLTPSGKLDPKALPAPDWGKGAASESSDEVLGEEESALAELWSAALGVENIGPSADFFELGGHSLLAIKLVARIKKRFQVEFTIGTFFENPTIGGSAQAIREAKKL